MVWADHAQMNIADKAFHGESDRVLAGGGLLFHDIFLGDSGPARCPAFWSEMAQMRTGQ